ncbi:recombinase family protein [Adlercreutzia sp. ZJ473]|uniref:recombinase family protein n=1 Tax=Adlercreutzia sp. ZJ473 TaxID=2722822 RepID=UPI001555E8E7|nr:recombinase family protein [Adlercreutzia sp. ZJ473]
MIACYVRLSVSDHEHDKDKPPDEESNSVQNQRTLLEDFIADEPELIGEEVRFFVDDGYSGTSFERPALQEMIALCKDGAVSTVIVKDFSRLARDYVDAGSLVENLFPFLGVRFIAVADNYDSARLGNASEDNFVMGFKNIINAGYSFNVSKSVKSGIEANWLNGKHVQGAAPFGYFYDKEARGNLRIDPVAGKWVIRTFDLAVQGYGTATIAATLNEEGVPAPSVYHEMIGKRGSIPNGKRKWTAWTSGKVRHILQNVTYKGTLEAGKTEVIGVGARKKRLVRPEDRIYVEDAHAALVTPDEWARANEVIRSKKCAPRRKPLKGLFSGIIVCPTCNMAPKTLREERVVTHYVANCPCGCDATVSEAELEEIVRAALQRQLQVAQAAKLAFESKAESIQLRQSGIARSLSELDAERSRVKSEKLRLYEAFSLGRLTESRYLEEKERVADALCDLAARECSLKDERRSLDFALRDEGRVADLIEQLGIVEPDKPMTREVIHRFVKQVRLHSDGSITLSFAFEDVFQKEVS